MPKLADCDPRALRVVMTEVERLVGGLWFDEIAKSEMSSTKQYGNFMYHSGQLALLDTLKRAIKKQEQAT